MLDVANLTAIDVQVHVHNLVAGGTVAHDSAEAAVGAYFGRMERHTYRDMLEGRNIRGLIVHEH